jgi:hypothetical protein
MANKTLREFSASTTENIRTGRQVNVGEDGFELKPALITMVQVSQFCGKAHEDASAHLQHFLEICSTFMIKRVTKDAILVRLFPFSLLWKANQWFYANKESLSTKPGQQSTEGYAQGSGLSTDRCASHKQDS